MQAVLKRHIAIDTGWSHPWMTALGVQVLGLVVGLAFLYILRHVFIASRPIVKKARRAIEQIKAEANTLREVSNFPARVDLLHSN